MASMTVPYVTTIAPMGTISRREKLDSSPCINNIRLAYLSSSSFPKVQQKVIELSLEMRLDQRITRASSFSSLGNSWVPRPHQQSSLRRSWRPSKVKSGDSEGSLSSKENMILDEQVLEKKLQIAIEEENYIQAAQIRDNLRLLHEDSKASVLAANARFYDAFRNGDLAAMQGLWAKRENVYCVHPGAGRISGYDHVMQSWEVVCGVDYDFPIGIELKNVEVHVRGDVGYLTCLESVRTKGSSWGKQVATNVFERINNQWLICIHHASHVDL